MPNVWLNLYEMARGHCVSKNMDLPSWQTGWVVGGKEEFRTDGKEERAAFGFLIAYYSWVYTVTGDERGKTNAEAPNEFVPPSLYMNNVDYLLQLLAVTHFPEFFADLEAPRVWYYSMPQDGARRFSDPAVLSEIRQHLVPMEHWRPRKNNLTGGSQVEKGNKWFNGAAALFSTDNDVNTSGVELRPWVPQERQVKRDDDSDGEKQLPADAGFGYSSVAMETANCAAVPLGAFGTHGSENSNDMAAAYSCSNAAANRGGVPPILGKQEQYFTDRGLTISSLLGLCTL